MIYATSWSFDCLKNWIEKGLHPKQAIKAQVTVLLASVTLAVVWVYQGLLPKILFPDTGELALLRKSELFVGAETTVLPLVGLAEILFGLIILFVQNKIIHFFNIALLLLLSVAAILSDASIFTLPFNPFSLNISLIMISIIAIVNFKYLPKASNCITKQE
jgi:hypothetical protein